MRLAVLCSGGKDSIYAAFLAMQSDEVVCLISIISENEFSYMFHTPNVSRVEMQAEAAGLPLVMVASRGEKEEELDDLEEAISSAREKYAIEGVVSGAIMSVYQAARIQKICRKMNLWCFNPLWYTDQAAYMKRLVDEGFSVIISGVFSEPFDESWLGRELDASALTDLAAVAERYRLTLSGEGGEFETFVLDAPFFSKKIEIQRARTSYRHYCGVYVIEEARLVEK